MIIPSTCLLAELSSREGEDECTVILGCLCLHQGHTPPCSQGTLRGSLYVNRRANSTHICTHQGTRGQYPALAAGGHRTSCSSQTSSTPSRSPDAHEAEGRL